MVHFLHRLYGVDALGLGHGYCPCIRNCLQKAEYLTVREHLAVVSTRNTIASGTESA